MYKRILVVLFLMQLLSAQEVSMRIGTMVVSKDRKFTSFFDKGMAGRAKGLDADLVRLQEKDLKENLLAEKKLDVLVYATYADELSEERTALLRSIDSTKNYSAVILWVTQPGFSGEPDLPLDIDAVGGASAKPVSIGIISQEVTPRLEKVKEILENGMADVTIEDLITQPRFDGVADVTIEDLVTQPRFERRSYDRDDDDWDDDDWDDDDWDDDDWDDDDWDDDDWDDDDWDDDDWDD